MRADSGYYDQEIVRICEAGEVEYFIVAEQRENLMKGVQGIPESAWRPLLEQEQGSAVGGRRQRRKRDNVKRKIKLQRKRKARFKGAPEVATMTFSSVELEGGASIRGQADADSGRERPAIVSG